MQVPVVWWVATLTAVAVLLLIDLVVTGRTHRAPSPREAALGVAFYSGVAVVFGLLVLVNFGARYGGEFAAGWLTEYSLSVDNLFVFMVLMARFSVPAPLQLRVLTIGIVLALVLRGLLIGVGAAAISAFSWVFYIFGAFLLWTAWSLLRDRSDGNDEPVAAEDSGRIVRLLERVLPTTKQWHGGQVLAHVDGRRVVTPMLITMVAIGTTDVLFALDSIPAIFGLTKEPFLVVSANAFALMGLRQLYFLVGGLLDRLVYLSQGLAIVLGFIAAKLIVEALRDNSLPFVNGGRPVEWAPHISVTTSLLVVLGTLLVTAVASLAVTRRRNRRSPGGRSWLLAPAPAPAAPAVGRIPKD